MSNISVFISYHKNYHLFKNSILKPIHVGSALANHKLNMQLDCDGINISDKNPNFCELTAQYWAWKNCNSDYIGFMHYRRLFNFSEKIYPEDKWGCVVDHDVTNIYGKYGLDDKNLQQLVCQYDVVIAKKWNVSNAGSKDMFDHYLHSDPKLHISDYKKALEILIMRYPLYKDAVKQYNDSEVGHFNNMFILRKELFDEYSEMMFNVLFELEKNLDISHYDMQEARVFGYISEWIFGIYITFLGLTKNIKIKELQRVFIDSSQVVPEENSIHVFFAADNKFSQHLGVAITSILDSATNEDKLYFHIMDGGISQRNKSRLKKLTSGKIEFLQIDDSLFKDLSITETMKHTSKHTYYRYLIPILKTELDRAIYLDCDLIVKKSLSELWSLDLADNYAAACEDTWSYPVFEWKKELGLQDDSFYFNAGVLLLNLSKMREVNLTDKLFICSREINDIMKYQDQDVLNLAMEKHVVLLPLVWNVQQTAFFDTGSSQYSLSEIEYSKKNPAIIHYSGSHKPWHAGCLNPLWKEYYSFLLISPWKFNHYKLLQVRTKSFYIKSKRVLKSQLKKIIGRR